MNRDCTVVVCSCDRYADLLDPFVRLFRRHWPDCPFELLVNSETHVAKGFDRVILTGTGKTWSQMLVDTLDRIETPYVILLMNDYFLESRVDTANVLARLGQAKAFDAANLRLNPNPPGRTAFAATDGTSLPLLEYPKNTAYAVTCQAGIWNRAYLRGLAARNRSAWEFERFGSFMLADERRPLLVTPTREFPFVDAVHKGYWEPFGVRVMKENEIDYDFTQRGLPPFKVRLVEGLKALVFAIFPWTLIVRVQNAFGCGAKERPGG